MMPLWWFYCWTALKDKADGTQIKWHAPPRAILQARHTAGHVSDRWSLPPLLTSTTFPHRDHAEMSLWPPHFQQSASHQHRPATVRYTLCHTVTQHTHSKRTLVCLLSWGVAYPMPLASSQNLTTAWMVTTCGAGGG